MEHAQRPQNNTLQTTGDNASKKKRRTPQKKREVRDPREFGELAEGTVKDTEPSNMHSLDKWFAEIASTMKEKTPRRRIAQDPRIKELIMRRIALPRSHDGRARKTYARNQKDHQNGHKKQEKGSRQRSIRQTHSLGKDGQRTTNKQAIRGTGILHWRKNHDIRQGSHRSHSGAHRKHLQGTRTPDRHTTMESESWHRDRQHRESSRPSRAIGKKGQSIR